MSKLLQRALFFTLLFFLTQPVVIAKTIPLSEKAEISLLTCSPGADLYSVFGHSALRVSDPENNINEVYNYGTFNFNTPNFYWKFTRGRLKYYLSVDDFNMFMRSYVYFNRSVVEQQLNLSAQQKQKLYALLTENRLPENRYYLYDFFYNNCSSQIRDILVNAVGDDIRFTEADKPCGKTFRELIDIYLKVLPWADFGIDMALGLPADKMATSYESMFLPDFLMEEFDQAVINGRPLVKKTRTLFEAKPAGTTVTSSFSTPVMVFWGLFILVFILTVIERKVNRHFYLVDTLSFGLMGLLGVFLLFLWTGTDHGATKNNLNILWALPFHLIIPFFIRKQSLKWKSTYLLVTGGVMTLLLVGWAFLPQDFHFATMPIVLIIALRSFMVYLRNKELNIL